jgi:3-methyladenine DNA glycosylase AlkD
MADVRSSMYAWHQESVAGTLDQEGQVDLALALFDGEYAEEKPAGTLFLQEILLPANALTCGRDVDRFAGLFAKGRIYDWNVRDCFCVKVLGPLIKREGKPCGRSIAGWRGSHNLWQARASLVAFVPVAECAEDYPLVESACQTVIRRPERFAKTAVGWILREVSRSDPSFVRRVVTENIEHFSVESLNNAIKTFDKEEKKAYRQLLRNA